MHGSERWRNVSRTLLAYLATAALEGAQVVHGDDTVTDTSTMSAFVRVRVDQGDGEEMGRLSDDVAELGRFRLVAECYVRNADGRATVAVDQAEALAESVQAALRARSLDLKDYVTDQTGATLVTGHTLRFTAPPVLQYAPPLAGWARRIVTASGWWVVRHTTG